MFQEQVRTTINSRSGSALVQDSAGRDGLLIVRMVGADSVAEVEAWYDSLVVWRETGEGREAPDAEGLLGGRFRGRLSERGVYTGAAAPFVPDEVAAVADLSTVLDDFLPRLPGRLAIGEEETDQDGWRIKRLTDERGSRELVERYEWTLTRQHQRGMAVEDTAEIEVDQRVQESGTLRWSRRDGPLGWTRRIVTDARVPRRGVVKRSVRSRVEQVITVSREPGHGTCLDR